LSSSFGYAEIHDIREHKRNTALKF
jgi:hypothetical protein